MLNSRETVHVVTNSQHSPSRRVDQTRSAPFNIYTLKNRTCTVRSITHVHVTQHTCTKESYMYSTFDVTHVHVTQHTCTKAVHVSTHVHVTQNVHVSTIKIIPGLIDQPSVQNLQAL